MTREPTVSRKDIDDAMAEARGGERVQKTWYISSEVVDRVTASVQWAGKLAVAAALREGQQPDEVDLTGIPETAGELVEAALWAEVLRLERQVNDGKPFPSAPGKLKTGPSSRGLARLREARQQGHVAEGEA